MTFRLAPTSADDALAMVDGIRAAEVLRGVRGRPGVDREALADDDRARLASWSPTSPRSPRSTSTRCSRSEDGAIAVDARFVVAFDAADERPPRYSEEEILEVDEPADAAARRSPSIGASERGGQDRQLGDEEPRQRRLRGRDLPGQPEGRPRSSARRRTQTSRTSRTTSTSRCSRSRPSSCVDTLEEVGDKGIAAAIMIPSGFAETGETELQQRARRHRARARRPASRAQHLRLLLHAGEPVRRRSARRTTSRAVSRWPRRAAASGWPSSASAGRPRWASRRSSGSATRPTSTRTTC